MQIQYTNKMLDQLKRMPAPISFDTASAFAQTYNISVRSVIAKIRGLGIDYKSKGISQAGSQKPKAPRVTKAMLVDDIEQLFDVKFSSLNNMTVKDLNLLLEIAKQSVI